MCSEILLPSHAPPSFSDRETLWNEVEKQNGERRRSLPTALTLPCRTSFPCRRTGCGRFLGD
ncbi:MobA/MobL family protein [Bifidobacterium pseudocatenulatum]|nr:MobA/MobL family protein [Bifidobacterium pseudocatenulatum]MCC2158705.1 MobA/MobL family protein [Bifidobacterium pseudocatenulatum]